MKKRIITLALLQILAFPITSLYAWNGESSFQPISRETIVRIADEMIDFSWSPLNTITNDTCTSDGTEIFDKNTR